MFVNVKLNRFQTTIFYKNIILYYFILLVPLRDD